MIKRVFVKITLLLLLLVTHTTFAINACSGHFINPITDICWRCLFPLSLGSAHLVSGDNPDTPNPTSPMQVCTKGSVTRVGLAIGYWEPFAAVDVTQSPYCLVNLGGVKLNIGIGDVNGAVETPASGTSGAFYQVHWYKYPLMAWLNILTSSACLQGGDYDVGYLSELDPAWGDDALNFLINPEAALFANPIAQSACVADAVASFKGHGIDRLFWCMGAQGSSYPLTGHVSYEYAFLQNTTLMAERLAYKLHRVGLIQDSSGENGAVCSEHYQVILPKSRYRYELVNPHADANSCHAFGHSVTTWQSGKVRPDDKANAGFIIWRKRNCVFL